jgi:hypothetical protein
LPLNEIHSPISPETTEVLYGNENIQKRTLEIFSRVKESLDGCNDSTEMPMNVKYEDIWNGYAQLKKNGVRLRAITEITPDNISYVKKAMKLFEIRHLSGLKSNFGIVDRKVCLLHSVSHEEQAQPLSHAIVTNAKALVEAQQFQFETLWKNAIPAEEEIREIEEGMKPPFTETLRDSLQIQKVVLDLVNSAKQEILMLLYSNTVIGNIFLKGGYEEVVQKNDEQNSGNQIRLRVIASQDIHAQIEKLMRRKEEEKAGREGAHKLEIHFVDTIQQQQQRLQNKISFLVVDSKVCIVEEERRPKDSNSKEVTSLATFTNTESIVLAHISIFETLWTRSELKKILKLKDV